MLTEDDILDYNGRAALAAAEVQYQLEVCAVDTLSAYYLEFEILVSRKCVTTVGNDGSVVILSTELHCDTRMVCCRVENAIEVVSLGRFRRKACVLEEELTLPLLSAETFWEYECMSTAL